MMDTPCDAGELAEFQAVEDRFNAAMVSNDVGQIADCICDDWVLVTPERGPIGGAAILQVIGSGVLTHEWMTKEVVRVKRYGDMAVVTGRGKNAATYQGRAISADEWITDIYRQVGGGWRCVLTHLTPAA